MANALRKYTHAIAGLDNFIKPLKSFLIIYLTVMFLATINRHSSDRIQHRSKQPVLPKLGVRHEMQRPAAALRNQEEAIHQRIRMVASKYNRSFIRDVFYANHIDAAKKSVGDDTNQRDDHAMDHQQAPLRSGINSLCGVGW